MTRLSLLWFFLTLIAANAAQGSHAEASPCSGTNGKPTRGIGLVIGNRSYGAKPLKTPKDDAQEIAKTLCKLNFEVDLEIDLNHAQMITAVQSLANTGKGKNLPIIFYYAGHGLQINGVNYLIPTDAAFTQPSDIPKRTISLDLVFDAIRSVGNAFPKIVILDACRANPLAEVSVNDWIPGLAAPVNAPQNTLIAFATDPGSVAADGVGTHSPYTRSLLKTLQKPGLPVESVFRRVREDVQSNTDGLQTPWENTSLTAQFYFWEPIFASVQINDADDDAIILVNGNEIAGWNNDRTALKRFSLEGGVNDVLVKVYNQRSYTGGIPLIGGHLPEGWHYSLQLRRSDGVELVKLSDKEDQPADNGPHHGKLFTVAKFQIRIDEQTGEVSIINSDFHSWEH